MCHSSPQVLWPEGSFPLHLDLYCSSKGLKKVILTPAQKFSLQFHGTDWNDEIALWLDHYLRKKPCKRRFTFDYQELSSFQRATLDKLDTISFGATRSYGDIHGKAFSRAVGNVCNINPWPLFIGCHRVISSSGELGGFAYGKEMKRLLLNFEGGNF